jgi:site-specific DNA-methyltransferase (adenine-specific)
MDYPKDFVNRAILGDCMEIMPLIPSKSIDLVLCDLPYGITSRNKWDEIIPMVPLWNEYKRLIKDNGLVILTSWGMFSAKLIVSATVKYQYSMVWCKPSHTNQLNAKKQPLRKHEDILVFYDSQPTYNPQGLVKKGSMTKQGKTSTLNYGAQDRSPYFQEWSNYPTSLVYTKTATTKSHPTEKPLELFEYLIKTYTNEGDLVLDNCAGSFTTAVASENLKRIWICIEKEDAYYKAGVERINKNRGRITEEQKKIDNNIFVA